MGVSVELVRRLCTENVLTGTEQDHETGPWRIPVKAVEAWLTQNTDEEVTPPQDSADPPGTPLWKTVVAAGLILTITAGVTGTLNDWFGIQDRLWPSATPTTTSAAVAAPDIDNSISITGTGSNVAVAGPGGNAELTINNINPTATPHPPPTATPILFESGKDNETLVIIADLNAQNGEDPRRVTQSLFDTMEEELTDFDDIRIERLYRSISERDGSDEAMRIAESPDINASIVIWGDYVQHPDPELYIHYDIAKQPNTYLEAGFEDQFSSGQILQPSMFEFKLQLGSYLGQVTAFNIGLILYNARSYLEAIDYFEKAADALDSVVADEMRPAILYFHGSNYLHLGRTLEAQEILTKLLPWIESEHASSGDLYVATLNAFGLVYDTLGEKQLALDFYNQTLPLRREVNDLTGMAITLNNIGKVYANQGENQLALDFFNQALTIQQESGDHSGMATALNNIGKVHDNLGEKQLALGFFNQALTIQKDINDLRGIATTVNNIGVIYDARGEKRQALGFYDRVLPLLQEIGDRSGEASIINNIGSVFDDLGEKQLALDFFNQALTIQREIGDRSGEASTINNIGKVHADAGENQEAINFFNQALLIQKDIGDRSGEAVTLNNIGVVYDSRGKMQEAIDFLNQALLIQKDIGNRSGAAATLNNIGSAYDTMEEKQLAIDFFNQALLILQDDGDRWGESITLWNIGATSSELGDLDKAKEALLKAVSIMEELESPHLDSAHQSLADVQAQLAGRESTP